jgi:hypothetical protein
MLMDVHVDGVLCGGDGTAALREQPANGAQPAATVPRLLLRDANLQQGADTMQQYVHSAFRDLFSGPTSRLGAGERHPLLSSTLHHEVPCTPQMLMADHPGSAYFSTQHGGHITRAQVASAHTGCRLRLGNCRVQRRNKVTGQPPRLLPTAEMVFVLDTLEASSQLLATQLFHLSTVCAGLIQDHAIRHPETPEFLYPDRVTTMVGSCSISCVPSGQVVDKAEVPAGQQMLLEGLLAATVARIDPPAEGWGHPGVASSRTGRCRSLWLADARALGGHLTELRLLDDRVQHCMTASSSEHCTCHWIVLQVFLLPCAWTGMQHDACSTAGCDRTAGQGLRDGCRDVPCHQRDARRFDARGAICLWRA